MARKEDLRHLPASPLYPHPGFPPGIRREPEPAGLTAAAAHIPAREEPLPGVSSSLIYEHCTLKDKRIIQKKEVLEEIASRDTDILVTFGAGDIDRLVQPIENLLREKYA